MSASFDTLLVPYSRPTPDDLARAFVATGVPAALTATGTTQGGAAALVNRFTTVTPVAGGAAGVLLASADLYGNTRIVDNVGAAAVNVYPESGGTIDGQAANLPVVVGPYQTAVFVKTAALTWATLGETQKQFAAVPTAAGTTTGTIPSIGKDIFVTVTSAGANDIVILPAPTPGTRVTLVNNATGYELRSSSPTTVAINGGTGSGAESAIAASMVVYAVCVSATRWIAYQQAAAGTLTAVEAAA